MTSSPSPDKIHTQPEISVIIPVYNSELHLKECLDSLLGQTYGDWEAICINDGSTDGSAEILADYAARDPRIHVFSQENRGQGTARNYGIREAHGKYISFMDADDYLSADFLEILYAKAQCSAVDVVIGATCCESPKRVRQNSVAPDATLNTFAERVNALPHGGPCDKLYRTDFLRQHSITFSEGIYWEDNPFSVQVCFYTEKIATAASAVYHYVLRKESTTRDTMRAAKRKADSLVAAKDIMDFCLAKKCSEEECTAVADFCLRNFISIENLSEPNYYDELEGILGSSHQLSTLRCKAIRRKRRKRWLTILKGLWKS